MRVVTPAETTPRVRELFEAEPGVAHLVVLPGAAVKPEGDLLLADVARECADSLLSALRRLGVPRDGSITVEPLDTVLSDAAVRAEEAAPGEGSDAVVWDELTGRIGEDSRFTASYQAFLTIACLLAAIGAITDSPVLVVGAMVLGPEFGPLAAIAVGLVLRRGAFVRRGALALVAGFPLAMAVTAGATLLFDATGLLSSGTLDHLDEVAFIYQVGPFSFIVAVLAGLAGILALTSAKSASLVGVFISVTTVPAAAFASVALVEGRLREAGLSALQLVVNLLGIVIAATLALLVARRTRRRRIRGVARPAG
ncbi:DUF389 domain-containing protein [Pseudonocardia ailaonensis]|uniref:DUF389 domain-containing protein n=2 Tax=Pseudonocardia ailaonensis TaxID=367279 RepID=A0ABN2MP14_9PSEU